MHLKMRLKCVALLCVSLGVQNVSGFQICSFSSSSSSRRRRCGAPIVSSLHSDLPSSSRYGVVDDDVLKKKITPFLSGKAGWGAAAAAAVPAVYLVYSANLMLDRATSALWEKIMSYPHHHHYMFESEVAATSFICWIAAWSFLPLLLGPERVAKNRIDKQPPKDPYSWAKLENVHEWFNPLVAYLGSIWIYHQFHHKPPLPDLPPSFFQFSVETVTGIVLYDLLFYPIHVAMHHAPSKTVKKAHVYHHSYRDTLNAVETVQHSYADGFMQVFVNIIVQQISPFPGGKHPLSRIVHNVVVTYLLTESHSVSDALFLHFLFLFFFVPATRTADAASLRQSSHHQSSNHPIIQGYDFPFMTHNLFPKVFGGSIRHNAHHADGKRYYQQYFKYLDDFFSFEGKGQDSQEGGGEA